LADPCRTCLLLGLVLLAGLGADVARASDPRPQAAHAASDPPPAHGSEPAAEQRPSLFAGDFGNILFTLLVFFLLLALLGRTAWRPLLNTLQARDRAIRDSIERARQERLEAEKLLQQYQVQLDQARKEASEIVEEGRRDAEVVRRRIQEEARQDANAMIERAKREIQLARDAAITELYLRAAELAVQEAANVVAKELTPDDHRRLVGESLERIRGAGPAVAVGAK